MLFAICYLYPFLLTNHVVPEMGSGDHSGEQARAAACTNTSVYCILFDVLQHAFLPWGKIGISTRGLNIGVINSSECDIILLLFETAQNSFDGRRVRSQVHTKHYC